jgi:cellulose biosynthesis protein BcsQ
VQRQTLGRGAADQLAQVLRRAEWVVVPVRPEPMTLQALGLFLPRLRAIQAADGGRPRPAGLVLTHYVGRSADHVAVRPELEAHAHREGTRVLGVVPFTTAIGMRLSTRGHHYRPAARYLLEVLDGGA